MNQAQVQRRINEFQRRFSTYGDAAMHLAYHAALPVALNPDLVHLLRINFFLDPPERLPYSIEFEFLLSSLCRQVDEGLYEIEPDIRAELLEGLSAEYDGERIEEIATLLWQYVDHYAPWENRVGLERAQQLTALNFLDIEKAQQWLDEAETKTRVGVSTEREWFLVMRAAVEKAGIVKDKARKQKPGNPSSARPIMLPGLPKYYVDRPEIIASIKQALLGTGNNENHNKIFIVGKGGIGKTTIAIAVANDPEVKARFPDGILWASSNQDTKKSLLAWLQSLGKAEVEASPVISIAEQIRALLKSRKALLIVDDVENDSKLEPFDVGGPMCKTIVTARTANSSPGCYITHLDSMTRSEAMSLLERSMGYEFINEKRSQFADLAKSLEYVPLALIMAGNQVKEGQPVEIILDSIQDEFSRIENKEKLWTILFLSSNPASSSRLRLDEELRDIDEGLQRARCRDQFSLKLRWAVRARALRRALLDVTPQIVHFSGHGADESGLMLEVRSGNTQPVSRDELDSLFEQFSEQIQCVVLNGCYSATQVNAIAQHIPYVIGLHEPSRAPAAIEFLVSFYNSLGSGQDIEFAYEIGCTAIAGVDEPLKPVLIKQPATPLGNISEANHHILQLTGAQRKQLRKAMLSAYPSQMDLEIFVDEELDVNLSVIADGSESLSQLVFKLIEWTENQGRTADLIRSLESDTQNPDVRRFLDSVLHLEPAIPSNAIAEENFHTPELTGAQRKQLRKAMLSAYPSQMDLEIFVDEELDVNLSVIADGSESLSQLVFKLIEWTENQGRTADLIRSLESDTRNPDVRRFLDSVLHPEPAILPDDISETNLHILKLPRAQRKQLREIILSAYPSRNYLEVFVDEELDANLSVIAGVASLPFFQVVYELISWAEANGRIEDLLRALSQERPNSEVNQLYDWFLHSSKGDSDKLTSEPVEVFISYSHKDEALKDELCIHLASLKHQRKIKPWQDRVIEAGSEWDPEIKVRLESADIILLLLTPRFLASEYCFGKELQQAIERHQAGTARVIPIIVKPCDWRGTPFSKLRVLPKDAKPLTRWDDQDEAFLNVVRELRKAIDLMQK